MKEKLKSWLEKTGYPLELHAYKTVLAHGYICEKSQMYTDIETGIAREIDLVAYLSANHGDKKFFYEIQLLIECKKSEKPIVVLSSEVNIEERFHSLFGHEMPALNRDNGSVFFNLHKLDQKDRADKIGLFSEKKKVGYSVVQGFGKSDENIYKGIIGLIKAYDFYRSEYHKCAESDADKDVEDWFRMQIPVLLVDAPLFDASLDESGELEIEESQWSSILSRVPWAINRPDQDRLINVQVVQKNFLSEFLEELSKFHQYLIGSEAVYFKT